METPAKSYNRTITNYSVDCYSTVRHSNFGIPTPPTSTANDDTAHAKKRRRVSPLISDTSSISNKDGGDRSETPPSSASSETMSLRLIIPPPVLPKEDHRTLAIRRAAAERWKPKLQRPFPKPKEVNEAYKLKLMRHYTAPTTSMQSDFIKPRINVSPRVDNLRQRFPKALISMDRPKAHTSDSESSSSPTSAQNYKAEDNFQLMMNKRITKSETAQRLAWQSFSATERDRIDREREAMMQSGLVTNDLIDEEIGIQNSLPEWRKRYTGKFAKEQYLDGLI